MVDYGAYPPGLSHSDLIHVGELTDPYDEFYENYEPTDEEMEEFLADNLTEFISDFNINKPWHKKGVTWTDLVEWYKNENQSVIENEYERQRDD